MKITLTGSLGHISLPLTKTAGEKDQAVCLFRLRRERGAVLVGQRRTHREA